MPARSQPVQPWPRLAQLARASGYIFAGTVTAVSPVKTKKPNEVATIRITFHVDRAIRGVRKGQSLTIRQWTGLWRSGEQYRVGQNLLMFLYRPSRLGLTSAVGGPLGRLPLNAKGQLPPGFSWISSLEPSDPSDPVRKRIPIRRRDFDERIQRAMEEEP